MSSASAADENENGVYQFRVKNMAGDASTFKATTIEELRMRLATQAGVLYPCIVLLEGVNKAVVEDSHEVAEVFRGSMQPYELLSINNEESAKKEVAAWSPEQWFEVVEKHERYGDENIVERAMPLKLADQEFERKMVKWARGVIAERYMGLFKNDAKRIITAIAFGIDVPAIADLEGDTFLHLATRHGLGDLLRALLGAAGNVDVAGHRRKTPLHIAANKGRRNMAKLLIEAGADVDKTDEYGRTAISWAACGHDDVVALLIDSGADVGIADMSGVTPLHMASRYRRIKAIHLLLQNGANLNSEDKRGRTPLGFARDEETRRALRGQ